MVLPTQEHKKRKAECLEVLEACTAFCIMESLGIVDLDEEELAFVLGLAAFALDNMSQLPRELRPINPMQEKDDLQFEFAFCFTKEEVHRLLPCLCIPMVIYIEKVGCVDGYIFLLILLHRLHNPVTYIDMEDSFGISWYSIARIFGHVLNHV